MTAQIVEISGQKIAMLPADEYERLLEMVEDQADLAAAERAERRREEGEEYLPFEMVQALLAGENALKVWRKHRGLTQDQLAAMADMRKPTISEIENGKAQGKPSVWRALADALGVTVDDILPVD